MTATTLEQIFVGKMLFPQVHGQLSLFTLPQNFTWLKHFSAEEIAEFLTELLESLNRSEQDKDWSVVADVIEAWKETASVKADPLLSNAVRQGLNELADGQGKSWSALKQELSL